VKKPRRKKERIIEGPINWPPVLLREGKHPGTMEEHNSAAGWHDAGLEEIRRAEIASGKPDTLREILVRKLQEAYEEIAQHYKGLSTYYQIPYYIVMELLIMLEPFKKGGKRDDGKSLYPEFMYKTIGLKPERLLYKNIIDVNRRLSPLHDPVMKKDLFAQYKDEIFDSLRFWLLKLIESNPGADKEVLKKHAQKELLGVIDLIIEHILSMLPD